MDPQNFTQAPNITTATIQTKKAILQAVDELKLKEPLIHEYAIPSTHDITDHLIKGTSFGNFTSKSFPTAEEFMERIGALDWFIKDEPIKPSADDLDLDEEENDESEHAYGVEREMESLPTMNLKIIDIRPVGLKEVFDIVFE